MVFDKIPDKKKYFLRQIHRQQNDNPILDLANKLQDRLLIFRLLISWLGKPRFPMKELFMSASKYRFDGI